MWDASVGINVPPVWSVFTGTNNVIAVIDTGIINHPDLVGRILAGYDMITDPASAADGGGRDSDASDPGDWRTATDCGGRGAQPSSWHGTHVAGIIAANGNNGLGIAGIDWGAKIVPVRALGKCGGTTTDIADSIRWAAGLAVPNAPMNLNPARLINMSLGGTGRCPAVYQSAIEAALEAGANIIVAAGNSSEASDYQAPANCPGVLAVGATGRNVDITSYFPAQK